MSSLLGVQGDLQVMGAEDIISWLIQKSPTSRAAHYAVISELTREAEAGRYDNPQVAWEREALQGTGEDSVTFTVPIDLSSRRTTRGYLASGRVAKARAQEARIRTHMVQQALKLLYEGVALRTRAEIERRAVKRLQEAARVVTRRREEGRTSGYEQSRIEIESELTTSDHRRTLTMAEQAHAELAHLLGLHPKRVQFDASLAADPSLSTEDVSVKEEHPWTEYMRDAAEQTRQASVSSKRVWVPQLAVSGGPHMVRGASEESGYKLGIVLDVPLFTRGQDLGGRADAEYARTLAQAQAAELSTRGALVRARRALETARQEVQALTNNTAERIERLERAAQSAYREGQLSLVELLDAQRVRTELECRELEVALAAKLAEVDLRAARGDYP